MEEKPEKVEQELEIKPKETQENTKQEMEERELESEFGIMSIPTLVVMKNGKIVQQVSGARPKEAILTMI